MAALIDTNILLRLLQPQHSQSSIAATAVAELCEQRADLCIAPQNLVEFWVVATRTFNSRLPGAGDCHGTTYFRIAEHFNPYRKRLSRTMNLEEARADDGPFNRW